MEQRNRGEAERKRPRRTCIRIRMIAFGVAVAAVVGVLAVILSGGKEQETQTGQPDKEIRVPSTSAIQAMTAQEDVTLLELTKADMERGNLVLVNEDYAYDPSQVEDLVAVYENKTDAYYISTVDLLVAGRIMQPLNNWLTDFYEQTGVDNVEIVAGHRTVEYQQGLRDNAIETQGQEHADNYIALPGHSEHHTGLAVDLDTYFVETDTIGGFDGLGAYSWLVDNAWKYGFVQRYPLSKQDITGISYEEWHFRYVGVPHAKVMSDKDLCLEEYIDYLKQYPYDGQHLNVRVDQDEYEIYYCGSLSVPVPTDREYEISGNNVDGFVVTVYNGPPK